MFELASGQRLPEAGLPGLLDKKKERSGAGCFQYSGKPGKHEQ
jgi:hypothetical protein